MINYWQPTRQQSIHSSLSVATIKDHWHIYVVCGRVGQMVALDNNNNDRINGSIPVSEVIKVYNVLPPSLWRNKKPTFQQNVSALIYSNNFTYEMLPNTS